MLLRECTKTNLFQAPAPQKQQQQQQQKNTKETKKLTLIVIQSRNGVLFFENEIFHWKCSMLVGALSSVNHKCSMHTCEI